MDGPRTRTASAGDRAAGSGAGVAFGEASRAWMRVAAYSFGGPAGQIAVLHRIVVDEKKWLDESTFLRALGYCMVLPGPEAQQLATWVGWKLHGVRGGLVAGGLFILPGFLTILALSIVYVSFGESSIQAAIFYGLKPAVLVIVVEALLRMYRRAVKGSAAAVVAGAAFVALFAFDVPFPAVILAAAAAGLATMRADVPPPFAAGAGPPGAHAVGRTSTSVAAGLVFLATWLGSVVLLAILLAPSHVLTREAVFFSKTAVVTFGGAYAVLTYVAQQAVDVYGWVAPGEMLDGLGLAETTPGPLIQVVQFVGFLGAYRNPGGMSPVAAGVAGSIVTTWVTFAPCFFFIFAGAPFLESILRRRGVEAAVRGITAAVAGVVLNLTVWFSMHTLFADTRRYGAGPLDLELPVWSTLDAAAAAIALVAAVLAVRWKAGLFTILAAGVLLGGLVAAVG